jgi:hypothetical protein
VTLVSETQQYLALAKALAKYPADLEILLRGLSASDLDRLNRVVDNNPWMIEYLDTFVDKARRNLANQSEGA